nr:MAG TPA: triphosphate pyrophosphohydrolase [Caudoviricetes sp.]
MIKYNIEIKYLLNGIEETRNMYYKSVNVLNDEQQEEVVQDFINSLKIFYGVSTILETHIWEHGKDKEKINLNKLKNYKALAYAGPIAQFNKVKEEYQELLNEVEVKSLSHSFIKNRDNFKAEALDLITATVNLLLLSGLSEQDFEKHIEKLESYKTGKYKR